MSKEARKRKNAAMGGEELNRHEAQETEAGKL